MSDNNSDIESLIKKCLEEANKASQGAYDPDDADKSAALFLRAQMELAFFLENVELKLRNSKNEISRLEGEKYFEFKNATADKKTTDAMVSAAIAKDPDVVQAKKDFAADESSFKKWSYLSASLKEGHIYFRSISKKV